MNKKLKKAISLLRDLHDLQNGAPLETERKEWENTMKEVDEFLTDNECDSDNGYQETTNPNEIKVQIEVEKLRVNPDGRINVMYNSNVFSVNKEDVIE